jgi:peptidoglycan/LPS O-acetylase OafA/YrhL
MNKIASVELLRFVSAMMVIIWHYQQFYLPYNIFSEVEILPFNRNTQPFYNYLSLFYNFGNRGVDFFFIISGYVFSYVYLFKNESVKFKFFFVNRLARLYPLHILTLIIVAITQFYNSVSFDNFLIHFNNDAYHFFLNLFFISGWGFEQGPSFNGPIWSVSVEIIIYFLFFFLIMNFKNNRVLNSILLILIFISIKKISSENFLNYLNMNLLNCGILFFEGVLVYYLSEKINKKKILFLSSIFLLVISLIGNFKMYIFLPSILMMFLSVENLIKNRMCKIFNFLGNLTYGTYLWHLPIQMCLIIFMKKNNINFSVIDTKIFFLLYLFFVISVSVISYYFFELKLRYLIRSKFNN